MHTKLLQNDETKNFAIILKNTNHEEIQCQIAITNSDQLLTVIKKFTIRDKIGIEIELEM